MVHKKKKIYDLLEHFSTCMLTTSEPDGTLISRPMVIADVSEAGEIFLVTADESKKVHEVVENSHVSLSCQEERSRYLSISGIARISHDRGKLRGIWTRELEAWFPDGPESPSAALMVVSPERGEYWDQSGLQKAAYLYETTKAYFTGTPPAPDSAERHGKTLL